jgi:cyanophycin synthetase
MENYYYQTFSTYCKKIMVLSDSLLDGIYIQNHMMEKGDTTGPLSAEYILKDPTVEFAVLETARGGTCDLVWVLVYVILLLLIFRRTLGLNDIHTLDDLAE